MTIAAGAYYWKREPGWTNLRGMWGKRSPIGDEPEDAGSSTHGIVVLQLAVYGVSAEIRTLYAAH